jgi:hypothetical protein
MTLNEFKNHLQNLEVLNFTTPNGQIIPVHFHVTELKPAFYRLWHDIHTGFCFSVWVAAT